MAEGDVILELEYEDGGPTLGSCGAVLYAAVAPLAYADEENGWPLAHLCEALGRMRQPISDMVRAWDERVRVDEVREGYMQTVVRSGWSRATHVTAAPGAREAVDGGFDMLPFLGQLVGVRDIEGLDDADRRAAIRERDGFSRGRPLSIRSFAERFTGGGGVELRERYDPNLPRGIDAPYHGRVMIKRSRVRGLQRVNLATNPRAQVNTAGASAAGSSGILGATLSRVACLWHPGIEWCYRVTGAQPSDTEYRSVRFVLGGTGRSALPVIPRRPYTISAYVNVSDPASQTTEPQGLQWAVAWFDVSGAALTTSFGPGFLDEGLDDARVSSTFTPPSGAVFGQFRLQQSTSTPDDVMQFELTAILLEQADELREFGDALTPGWRADGTLHASQSRDDGITADEIRTRVLARVPAGLIYDVLIVDYAVYDDIAAETTYAGLNASVTNYDDLLEG
ncbi:hypothetical protein [Conexibacter sp. CPCC 206217]|uniref:hypothetical protein n=1 Tax=Conexibacter sp. CPCC 206217 TaxID=3064574 RepID=UPI00271C2C2D|nr:hypothetical protein [Conexibacter sp. CPCC 206217]MDO8209285.1 hypothetical protein [Conexibacter sp. CPCC 206217]